MKKTILTAILFLVLTGVAFSLTTQEIENERTKAVANMWITEYQSAVSNQSSAKNMIINYKRILNLSGVNWNGVIPYSGGVNWTAVK